MELSFEGKTVLVTGAARGIGRGIVEAFARDGARVIATDVLEEELATIVRETPCACGGSVEARRLDVTSAREIESLVREAEAGRGRIDVAVHVAGGVLGATGRPLEEVTEREWDGIFQVNLKGAFLLARAVAPGMRAAGSGRIIVISSRAALTVSLTGIHAYGAAKTAQVGLVRQLAEDLGPSGITVNAVAPGFLRTSPDYQRQWDSYGPSGQRALIERIAMRRLGEPADVSSAVLFLASEHASWITGQVLAVTGGPV